MFLTLSLYLTKLCDFKLKSLAILLDSDNNFLFNKSQNCQMKRTDNILKLS